MRETTVDDVLLESGRFRNYSRRKDRVANKGMHDDQGKNNKEETPYKWC